MVTMNLLIQGDAPNAWFVAQGWQHRFLTPLHTPPNGDTLSRFTKNRNFDYMAFPLTDLTKNMCPDLQNLVNDANLLNIPFYSSQSRFMSWINWSFGSNPYGGIPPVGILCNMTTGTCRLYMFTTDSAYNIQNIHKHNGPIKACHNCINGYAVQRDAGSTIPLYATYHVSGASASTDLDS